MRRRRLRRTTAHLDSDLTLTTTNKLLPLTVKVAVKLTIGMNVEILKDFSLGLSDMPKVLRVDAVLWTSPSLRRNAVARAPEASEIGRRRTPFSIRFLPRAGLYPASANVHGAN